MIGYIAKRTMSSQQFVANHAPRGSMSNLCKNDEYYCILMNNIHCRTLHFFFAKYKSELIRTRKEIRRIKSRRSYHSYYVWERTHPQHP